MTALVLAMPDADDEVMQNILVALWRLGDPDTPILPLVEVLALHHDPAARANAALALSAVVTRQTLPQIEPAVRTALGAERRTCVTQHDRSDGSILRRRGESGSELLDQHRGQRISILRRIQRHVRCPACQLVRDRHQ